MTRRLVFAIMSTLLLTSTFLLPTSTQAQINSANAPRGLVVVIEDKPEAPLDLQALDNPSISGVALQIHWSDLEPVQGAPNWAKLDRLFSVSEASHKWVQLLIFPGFFSPDWALRGVRTAQFPIQYGPGKGTVMSLPMPFNELYLNRWFAFLKRLSARYGSSPAFRMIAAAGPTSVSAEFTLPATPADIRTWQSFGYTPTKYIGAWQQVFEEYASDFPNQYISLSVGAGLNINDQGRIDPSERLRTRQGIVDAAMSSLGNRFALQLSDVHAGPAPNGPDSQDEDQFVIGYNGRIVTGLQMRTSAENGSAVMGAQGDPPGALRKSLDLAMLPNASGQRVNFVEIYEPDVLAPEMQPVLKYGASLFSP